MTRDTIDGGATGAEAADGVHRFRTTLLRSGKTATGIEVPPEVVARLGSTRRPAVRVTINGHPYRSTVAVMGGVYMLGVSAEIRRATGVSGGDEVDIELVLDTAVREVAVPRDLAAALDADVAAKRSFDGLSYSRKQAYVLPIEAARTAKTRQRRVVKAVMELAQGATRR